MHYPAKGTRLCRLVIDHEDLRMRILITGARGQLGSAIAQLLPEQDVLACDLPLLDVTDLTATRKVVSASGAQIVVHCAAFTDVD